MPSLLLVPFNPGAYTTARTVNRLSVFEFEFHVSRLGKHAVLYFYFLTWFKFMEIALTAQSVDLMIKAEDQSHDENWQKEIRKV